MVGLDDTVGGSTVPAAVGDGWFSGSHAGTVRQRKNLDQEPLRTQWSFRFDISALSGISPADITGVTINIPQIGRLNSNPGLDTVPLRIFDVNASWDTTEARLKPLILAPKAISIRPDWVPGKPSRGPLNGQGSRE